MPLERTHFVKYLMSFQMDALVLNRPKIAKVARAYRDKRLDLDEAERMVSLLASKNKKARQRGEVIYEHFLDRGREGLVERLNARKRARDRTYQMKVLLFTTPDMRDKGHVDAEDEQYPRYQKYLKGKYKDKYSIFWVGELHVVGTTKKYLDTITEKLVEKKNQKQWKTMYKLCMTDFDFKNRETLAPGYVQAIMVLRYTEDRDGPVANPADAAMAAAGDKMTINYRYCCNQLDLAKDTFAEAMQNNLYKSNECWINTIYDFYGETLLDPNKHQRYRIERKDILQILGKTEENVKDGLTIQEVVPFFEKFKLKLRVYDIFRNLVFKYDPPVDSRNNPAMFCMFHERHIYTLNHDLDRLAQKGNDEEEEQVAVSVGTDYRVKDCVGRKHWMIDNVDDILELLKNLPENGEPSQDTIWMIQRQDDLEKILMQMRDRGHTPQVKFQRSGKLSMIADIWNKQTFIIKTQQLTPEQIDGVLHTSEAEIYDKIDEVFADTKNKVLRMEHKSYYNKNDMIILDNCRTVANVGWLETGVMSDRLKRELVEIDMTKAYTWAFMQIKNIPIFNEFDQWKPYVAGGAIKPLNLYLLRNKSLSLVGNKEHTLCYGKFLPANPDILAVKEPSFIKKVSYKEIIEKLMATQITEDSDKDKHYKKQIANTIYGLLEMHINKNSKSFIFDTYNDCKYYQAKYGGIIHQIQQYEERRYEYVSPLDEGITPLAPTMKVEFVETDKTLYVLNIYAQADMTNGFRYIKELLMQHFNQRMQESLDKLRHAGIKVYTVKTDAFTVREQDLAKAVEVLGVKMEDEKKEIGDWRWSKEGMDVKLPYERLNMVMNSLPEIRNQTFAEIGLTLEQEYDPDHICQIFEEKKRVMVRADFPGSGKSFACRHMEKRGHKVLFVCPTNKLASNYGEKGITINKFFGVGLTEESRLARFDASGYDTIVFEEIFFCNIKNLTRIKRYSDQHPEQIIIATGDTDQLECIDLLTNQRDYDEYSNMCINCIFPYSITLRENKRLKSKEHRKLLKQIKKDIFNENISVKDIINKYFKMVDKITTSFNIAYKNRTCHEVSMRVRSMLKKHDEYEVGESLICRKYTKLGKSKIVFNVNYEYTITAVSEATVQLDNTYWLPKTVIRSAFTHNYCRTCHSFQGSSIDEGITVFDWGNFFVNRKWLWTAITRARDLSKVYFWKYDEKPENMNKLMEYLGQKIRRYKGQDNKDNRSFDEEDYITPEILRSWLGTCCQSCGDVLNLDVIDKKIVSNVSAQRLDNELPHEKDNCVPWCGMCNCMVSNRD